MNSAGATAVALHEQYRSLHAAASMALFCVGLYAASFGPVLPFLADDLGVSLDTAGLMLTALFIGSISASASIALALHGRDPRLLTIVGLICAIAGAAMIGVAPAWPVALAGGAVLGFGDGFIVAALHILVAATSRDANRAINTLNMYFAFGAIAGPLWAGAILATAGERWIVYAGICAVEVAALAALVAARGPTHEQVVATDEPFRLPGNATAWIMGAVLFLYVGAEFGLGSWVSEYTRESADAGVFSAALLASGYWAALALGRIVSSVYFSRSGDASRLLAWSIAGAGVASVALILSTGNIALGALAAFAVGLCLGPIWPSTVAITSQGGLAHATATTVTIGNAGGVFIPWAQGRVLVGAGPDEGIAVTAVLCALMFAVVIVFRLRRTAVA